ncbi:MAG: zinc-ribbon domain-containing protein [Pseudomonadota bacterium]
MIVVCKECDTRFNLEDGRIKPSGSKVRCSRCDNIFMVFPPFEAPVVEPPAAEMIFEDPAAGVSEAGKEEPALSDEELDLSEFDKMFDEEVPAPKDAAESKDFDAELSDTEDMDFSDLEKMLEIDIRKEMSEKKLDESASDDIGDLDLSELENIIDNLGEAGVEEEEGEPEELKFDIEPAQEEIVSKIDDEEEVDFSDLEKMLDSDNDEKTLEKQEESDLKFDLEPEPAWKKDEADDVGDLDLSELDKIISSLDESEPAGALEKEPEETLDLDFSDFESVLAGETTGVEKTGEEEQVLELKFDSVPEEAETSEERPDDLDLDFSEVEKMLEMDEKTDLPVQEITEESPELKLGVSEPPGKPQPADEWADTIVTGKDGLGLAEKEPEEEAYPHLEEYAIGKFQNTMEESEAAVAAAEPGEKTAEPEKERKPLKSGKPSGKFLSILAVIVIIIAGAGAFVVYNPFGIEIPFVSDFIGSKADEKGTLRIIPADDSIKGDFVQTRLGSLFVITGKVKNEYKHPRSYISVTGKLFKKGKVLLKAETVYCGNVIPENEIGASNPALMKKRLQNRIGNKKSNIKVQPGGIVPFMIIFENVTDELDEFSVEAAGSVKE